MTVLVAKLPGLLPDSPPYFYCTCDRCEAALGVAQPYSAEAWKAKHEAECKGAASVLARSP